MLMFFSNTVRLLSLLLCFVFIQGIGAEAPLKVVTVTEDFAAITREIGGDKVQVSSLITGSRDLHSISPKPSMILKVRRADMLIRLGMSQDTWVDSLIQSGRNPKISHTGKGYLDASTQIEKKDIPTHDNSKHQGDVHKEGNPHYWLSPLNGIIIAKQITEKLVELDPQNKAFYEENYTKFSKRITEKVARWKQQLAPLQETHFLTYHKVWTYFFDAFNLHQLDELEPVPGIPPTTRHLADLNKKMKAYPTVHILMASFYPKSAAENFAKTHKIKITRVPINVGEGNTTTYDNLFDNIIKALLNA